MGTVRKKLVKMKKKGKDRKNQRRRRRRRRNRKKFKESRIEEWNKEDELGTHMMNCREKFSG